MTKTPNKVKCRHCKKYFNREDGIKVPCGFYCSIEHAREHTKPKAMIIQAKHEKKRSKARKESLKTRGEHQKEVQVAFNHFIRLRDKDEPCISCQRYHQGQIHAGHYLSVGSRVNLRFDENNCHAQCAPCNNHLSGNLINYRINLIKKLGVKEVERLESDHEPRRYTIEQLNDMKVHYRDLCRKLKKAAA